jgi:hypothetical protein
MFIEKVEDYHLYLENILEDTIELLEEEKLK